MARGRQCVVVVVVSQTDEVGCGENERDGKRGVVDEGSGDGREVDDDDNDGNVVDAAMSSIPLMLS